MRRTAVIIFCALAWVLIAPAAGLGQGQEQGGSAPADASRWNDVTLLVGEAAPGGAYGAQLPVPTAADALALVAHPPEDVKFECATLIQSALAPRYLPQGFADHLIAVEGSPTFSGHDVFVVWYTTQDVLIHLVDTSLNLTITVLQLQPEALVPEEQRGQWLLARAAEILRADMQPHPLTPPEGLTPRLTDGFTRLSWSTLAAPLERDPREREWLFTLNLGALGGPVLDYVRASTDGRCLTFFLGKLFPWPSWPAWTDRFAAPSPAPPQPPPPRWQPNLEPIEFKTELTAEEQANQVN